MTRCGVSPLCWRRVEIKLGIRKENLEIAMTHSAEPRSESKKEVVPPADFTTFSIGDISGALSSAQRQRLIEPVQKLWRRIFKPRAK